jgi:hypothetical protein
MVESKLTCPKWHFGQVKRGGKKNHMGGFFNQYSRSKKLRFLVVRTMEQIDLRKENLLKKLGNVKP